MITILYTSLSLNQWRPIVNWNLINPVQSHINEIARHPIREMHSKMSAKCRLLCVLWLFLYQNQCCIIVTWALREKCKWYWIPPPIYSVKKTRSKISARWRSFCCPGAYLSKPLKCRHVTLDCWTQVQSSATGKPIGLYRRLVSASLSAHWRYDFQLKCQTTVTCSACPKTKLQSLDITLFFSTIIMNTPWLWVDAIWGEIYRCFCARRQ